MLLDDDVIPVYKLKRNYWYMWCHDVINDGMTEEAGMFDIFYPFFVFSGLAIFMVILRFWYRFKDKIK